MINLEKVIQKQDELGITFDVDNVECQCDVCRNHKWEVGMELDGAVMFNLRDLNKQILYMNANDTQSWLKTIYKHSH